MKFSGDPEEDDYRYKQSKYRDKLVVALRAAVEVAEINGIRKTKQQAAPRVGILTQGLVETGKSVLAVLERDWTSTNPSHNLWTPMALTPEGVAGASFKLPGRPWAALNTT